MLPSSVLVAVRSGVPVQSALSYRAKLKSLPCSAQLPLFTFRVLWAVSFTSVGAAL